MNGEEFKKMLQLYKVKLADVEEQNILYQAIISSQVTEKEELKKQLEDSNKRVDILEEQINNMNSAVQSAETNNGEVE